ncbi:MAG: FAD-binding protein [Pirellulaceae bacterium]
MIHQPRDIDELQSIVRRKQPLRIRAGGTKGLLSQSSARIGTLDMQAFSGIVEYQPTEFTITVGAATPLSMIRDELRGNNQFLPFDPPLIDQGATIGGTIAAGLSGPGMFRFGTIRDYILQVRMVDGLGNAVCVGGKVVKNAAGFDVPKLVVGSLGRLGPITEVTLKVFPDLECRQTLVLEATRFEDAFALQNQLAGSPLGIEAIDLLPPAKLLVRVCGSAAATNHLVDRIASICQAASVSWSIAEDNASWEIMQSWRWHQESERLIKIPISPRVQSKLNELLSAQHAPRRYSARAMSLGFAGLRKSQSECSKRSPMSSGSPRWCSAVNLLAFVSEANEKMPSPHASSKPSIHTTFSVP